MGVYTYVGMPSWQGFAAEKEVERGASFEVSVKIGSLGFTDKNFFQEPSAWGRPNLFSKPWDEIVYPESSLLPQRRASG